MQYTVIGFFDEADIPVVVAVIPGMASAASGVTNDEGVTPFLVHVEANDAQGAKAAALARLDPDDDEEEILVEVFAIALYENMISGGPKWPFAGEETRESFETRATHILQQLEDAGYRPIKTH